ncbi:MAG: hypothetical protein RSB09_03575, partial [Clostridia bacterium]
ISAETQNIIVDAITKCVVDTKVFEVVEVSFFKEFGKLNITAFIWKKDGISLDDCEVAHNIISAELDKFDNEFSDEYILNVSSSGLDRQIASQDDFRRALDTDIEVIIGKGETKHGILMEYDAEQIKIKTTGKSQTEMTFALKDIEKVQPYIKF